MSKKVLPSDGPNSSKGQFLVYEAEDGRIKIDVRLESETVWLTQQLMADLFQTTKQNISLHIQSIYNERELVQEATVKKYLSVRREGSREVRRVLDYYSLDMIISVGYRVKSHVATRFRIWATQRLREFIIKGFVLDDERLNYLTEEELLALNNLVEQYLIFAEGQAMRRIAMHMAEWIRKLDAFLTLNERDILAHAGSISHEMAMELAEGEYEKFSRKRIRQSDRIENDFDRTARQLADGKRGKKA